MHALGAPLDALEHGPAAGCPRGLWRIVPDVRSEPVGAIHYRPNLGMGPSPGCIFRTWAFTAPASAWVAVPVDPIIQGRAGITLL